MNDNNNVNICTHKNTTENMGLRRDIIAMLRDHKYSVAETRGLFADILKHIECKLVIGTENI